MTAPNFIRSILLMINPKTKTKLFMTSFSVSFPRRTEKMLQEERLQAQESAGFLKLIEVRERYIQRTEKMGDSPGYDFTLFSHNDVICKLLQSLRIWWQEEKERKTLETLLVSSVGRLEIVCIKYLTIITWLC